MKILGWIVGLFMVVISLLVLIDGEFTTFLVLALTAFFLLYQSSKRADE